MKNKLIQVFLTEFGNIGYPKGTTAYNLCFSTVKRINSSITEADRIHLDRAYCQYYKCSSFDKFNQHE